MKGVTREGEGDGVMLRGERGEGDDVKWRGWRRWCDGGRGEGDGVMGEGCD